MQDWIDKLNDKQKEAVTTTEGPLMVMAGAGSGKTRVLTNRIAYLINHNHVSLRNILAVTFTNKAAREMKERINSLVDTDVTRMWVATFHSFCARVLRMEISAIKPYETNFTIIDEEDAVKILKDIIKDMKYDIKEVKPKIVKCTISSLKNDMISSIDDRLVNNIYEEYQKQLMSQNLLDFDDLILLTIELFKNNQHILEKYQNLFKYILVDEFQDTNTPQYKLMYMLAYKYQNIFVVGDQDQSIYSFRGAKIENIDKFRRDFPLSKVILLEENYRSTSSILNIANKVIDNNNNRFKKNLFTSNNNGNKPVYYSADSSYDEVMFVIEKIKELVYSGYSYNDFAIIYRANSLSRSFEDSLVKYQIPYTIYGGMSFFSRKEIKDVIAYLRLIINNDDDFSFKRIVNEPRRKIGPALLARLQECALANHTSLFNAIDKLKPLNNMLLMFKDIITYLHDVINELDDITKVVDILLDKTGYYDMLKSEGEEGKDRLDNIREFKSVLRESDEFYEGSKLEKIDSLLADLALRSQTDQKSEAKQCVKLMTYHQAKGLEYRTVFLVAFEQGIFPSSNCYSKEELEEERRVCYVGITRAMEKLYFTSAETRFRYGSESYQLPSFYLDEIGLENLNVLGMLNKKEFIQKVNSVKPIVVEPKEVIKVTFNVGDKISHKLFGDGMVVKVMDDDLITVAFKVPHGIKNLNSSHPSIRKIT